jgi:uncharacterized protein YuzE
MKITRYFEALRVRPDRAIIREEWIERAIRSPVKETVQADGRIRRWVHIPDLENRALRVVIAAQRNHSQFIFRSKVCAMRIRYFEDTDTLLIEFKEAPVGETRDLDENTVLDLDAQGNVCAITIEHASRRAGIPQFSYEQIAA